MTITLLTLTQVLGAAVALKNALEGTGSFRVYPFTDAAAAVEFLRARPAEAVLLELTNAEDLRTLQTLLRAQPSLAVLVATDDGALVTRARRMGALGAVRARYSARDVLRGVHRVLLGDTAAPAQEPPLAPTSPPAIPEDEVSSRLAREEPPRPSLANNSTVGEALSALGTGQLSQVWDVPPPPDTWDPPVPATPSPQADATPVERILEAALDATRPLEALASEWGVEEFSSSVYDHTTRAGANTSIADLQHSDTAPVQPLDQAEHALVDAPALPPEPPAHSDDSVARLAVALTQASLEMAAEATLLLRAGRLVALEGRLAPDDRAALVAAAQAKGPAPAQGVQLHYVTLPGGQVVLLLRQTDHGDTLGVAVAVRTPIADIRRQSERLLSALQAAPSAPAPPLAQPDVMPQPQAPSDEAERARLTFVWLLRDAAAALPAPVMAAMRAGLHVQLAEQGWHVVALDVQEDHISLLADAPPGALPPQQARTLIQRSAQIAQVQDATLDASTLWADGYLVIAPGRPLDADELRQFLQFQRM